MSASPDIAKAPIAPAAAASPSTFTNPIAPGADPWVIWHGEYYYWCASEKDLGVAVFRSARLTEQGEKVVVWHAPAAGPHSREVWAPELHRLDGKWYIYVAASNGENKNHRMIVLESAADEPTRGFAFKAELYTGDEIETGDHNRWAIDGTILEHGGQRYLVWSGWADERDEQWLYIATLANPWTVSSNRTRLTANDDFCWERIDETSATRGLNEAPQVLQRNGRTFIVYSASASWETSYKLGLLELVAGSDPMARGAWRKHAQPVFQATATTWGVGHCSFTRSPDGSEDWIVFHAKLERAPNWNRAIHVQRFHWDECGRPFFGEPIAAGIPLVGPGSEIVPAVAEEVAFGRAALAAALSEPLLERVVVTGTVAKS